MAALINERLPGRSKVKLLGKALNDLERAVVFNRSRRLVQVLLEPGFVLWIELAAQLDLFLFLKLDA